MVRLAIAPYSSQTLRKRYLSNNWKKLFYVISIDAADQIKNKINRHAFSGGGDTLEKQVRLTTHYIRIYSTNYLCRENSAQICLWTFRTSG